MRNVKRVLLSLMVLALPGALAWASDDLNREFHPWRYERPQADKADVSEGTQLPDTGIMRDIVLAADQIERDFNLLIFGKERLTAGNVRTLRGLLSQVPRGLIPTLRIITVDMGGQEEHVKLMNEHCPRQPNGRVVPCISNILSGMEFPSVGEFPPDTPGLIPPASLFYVIAAHEISGHQIALYATGVFLDDTRGLATWQRQLIQEAGCEPMHYLRSMFRPCTFVEFPQEFIASLHNQWLICSQCVLRLALTRFRDGNPHPMNQAVFLMLLHSHMAGYHPTSYGLILGYRVVNNLPVPEVWTGWPGGCPGRSTFSGPDFSLGLEFDFSNGICHVVAVTHADGL